jgi:hypothetical protein
MFGRVAKSLIGVLYGNTQEALQNVLLSIVPIVQFLESHSVQLYNLYNILDEGA